MNANYPLSLTGKSILYVCRACDRNLHPFSNKPVFQEHGYCFTCWMMLDVDDLLEPMKVGN